MKYASLCNSDKRLVDEVAEMWVDYGGDAEGVDWVMDALKERIAEIIEERKVANAPNHSVHRMAHGQEKESGI